MTSRSEKGIIDRIRRQSVSDAPDLLIGIGDDCAVIKRGGGVVELITTDTLVEKVHFDPAWHEPELLGRKAAAVNLSDVAAMGGRPRFCLLSLALPAGFSETWLDSFMSGFMAMLAEHDTLLIGGDTVRSGDGTVISVTVLGEASEKDILRRSTARPGDLIMVSGSLGEAAAGLEICRSSQKTKSEQWQQLVASHLDPVPERVLGLVLAESGLINAMMDISDGLATDLAHLCDESRVGAEIDGDSIPMSEAMVDAAGRFGKDPIALAIGGGEDYRLLFTVPAADGPEIMALIDSRLGRQMKVIGRIVEGSGVIMLQGGRRTDISYQGYDHFKK